MQKINFTAVTAVCFLLLPPVSNADVESQSDYENASVHPIIGGEIVTDSVFPGIVALTYNLDAELVQRQFCGGSVIADNWVLTAAHCLYDGRGDPLPLTAVNVAVNADDLGDEDTREIGITNIFVHPEYNHNAVNPHSDIALLELAESSGVAPVVLSKKPMDELVGMTASVAGWGAVDNSNPSNPLFPIMLHAVNLPVVSLEVCNAPISYDSALFENQLCAGFSEGGRDSCVGDSGGPLLVNTGGVRQQIGVVSFGYGCALPNYYGIYTNVPYFIGWINQYVYIGEPEFNPEATIPRTAQANIPASGEPNTGRLSWTVLLLLMIGAMAKRRR